MKKSLLACAALGALLASAPARAQLAQTPLHMSVREFLAASFEGAKAKYVIGTGLDGELILSIPPAKLTPSQAFRIVALAVDYPIERVVVDGIHVIRRKTGLNAPSEPKKPIPTPSPLKKAKK
jgi:hypothetical protein